MTRLRYVIFLFAFTFSIVTCPEHVDTFMTKSMLLALALSVSAAMNARKTHVGIGKAADGTPTYVCQRWDAAAAATEVHE